MLKGTDEDPGLAVWNKGRREGTEKKKKEQAVLPLFEMMLASLSCEGTLHRQCVRRAGHTGVFPPGNNLQHHCFLIWRIMNNTVIQFALFLSVELSLCCQPFGFIDTTGSLEKYRHYIGFWALCFKRNVWIVLFDKKKTGLAVTMAISYIERKEKERWRRE